MRNLLSLLALISLASCQTTKIKHNTYRLSSQPVELAQIGEGKSYDLENDFKVRALPDIQDRVRLSVEIVPFTKKLDKVYQGKAKYNQAQSKSTYVDSLPKKPELALITVLDNSGMLAELNAPHNAERITLAQNTQDMQMVTGIAIVLSTENLEKIRQSDASYLISSDKSKLSMALYKDGKKSAIVHLPSEAVLSYRISKLCWGLTDRGKSYIADIVEVNESCMGNTTPYVREKEREKSLYRM